MMRSIYETCYAMCPCLINTPKQCSGCDATLALPFHSIPCTLPEATKWRETQSLTVPGSSSCDEPLLSTLWVTAASTLLDNFYKHLACLITVDTQTFPSL